MNNFTLYWFWFGIKSCLQAKYRQLLMQKVLASLDAAKGMPKISVKDCIVLWHSAWKAVSVQTIQKCFQHAGFNDSSGQPRPSDEKDEDVVKDDFDPQVRLNNTMPKNVHYSITVPQNCSPNQKQAQCVVLVYDI